MAITPEMIEAGAKLFSRAAWQHPRPNPEAAAELIYAAMRALDREVERLRTLARQYEDDREHLRDALIECRNELTMCIPADRRDVAINRADAALDALSQTQSQAQEEGK